MEARQIAARFAAYTWYTEVRADQASPREATRFARANWQTFLPVASKEWGRLLRRIAAGRTSQCRPRRRVRAMALAVAE